MIESNKCTGCGACKEVCPVGAIKMKVDKYGFLYPYIDSNLCIHCFKCERVCPVEKSIVNSDIYSSGIAISKDINIREKSSSGGIFNILANKILEDNGVVFGCAMSKDCSKAEHIIITSKSDIYKIMGSKYIQSELNDIFYQVKKQLSEGKKVLFSGTPCQIAGLKYYLGGFQNENLYLIDFICHGVPSPLVWKKYKELQEKKFGCKVINVFFRNKKYGWRNYSLSLEFEDNNKVINKNIEDIYLRGFISDLFLRPSCNLCVFKDNNYYSDITLGDSWGIENITGKYNDDKGVSLVITHSVKGKELLDSVNERIEYMDIESNKLLENNVSYYKPVKYNKCSRYFWNDFKQNPVDKAIIKYVGRSFDSKIRRKVISIINREEY